MTSLPALFVVVFPPAREIQSQDPNSNQFEQAECHLAVGIARDTRFIAIQEIDSF